MILRVGGFPATPAPKKVPTDGNRISTVGETFPQKTLQGGLLMRASRVLERWHWFSTDIKNREGVFRLPRAVRLLREVFCEARKIYEFELRGLRVEDDRVSFYINAADGFAAILLNRGQLPEKPL
jgi:hypothetical protein